MMFLCLLTTVLLNSPLTLFALSDVFWASVNYDSQVFHLLCFSRFPESTVLTTHMHDCTFIHVEGQAPIFIPFLHPFQIYLIIYPCTDFCHLQIWVSST